MSIIVHIFLLRVSQLKYFQLLIWEDILHVFYGQESSKTTEKGISWKFMDNVFYFIPILWTIKKYGQCLLFCTSFMDNQKSLTISSFLYQFFGQSKTWTMSSILYQFYGQSKNMDNVFYFVPILWTIKNIECWEAFRGLPRCILIYWCIMMYIGYIGVICSMSGYIGLYWGTSGYDGGILGLYQGILRYFGVYRVITG